MKQRNIRGFWTKLLPKIHIRYGLVDKNDYVCVVYHDRISATRAANDMNRTEVTSKPFKVKRMIATSWF